MISPLEAFSALTQMQAPATTGASLPTAPTGASEGFNIPHLTGTEATPAVNTAASTSAVTGAQGPTTWGHMVQQMVMDVNSKQQNATAMVNDVLKGGPTPVHQAMVATEEASLSFEFLAEMRNKVVEAYQQVMQMQV